MLTEKALGYSPGAGVRLLTPPRLPAADVIIELLAGD
jgi:hypothetical protein